MIKTNTTQLKTISKSAYTVRIVTENGKAFIQVFLREGHYYTRQYPKTVEILNKLLPDVFDTQCFNDGGISFYEEVRDTETAHLLEHLILTKLKANRIENNSDDLLFTGYTEWDWNIIGKGIYNIVIEGNGLSPEEAEDAVSAAVAIVDHVMAAK